MRSLNRTSGGCHGLAALQHPQHAELRSVSQGYCLGADATRLWAWLRRAPTAPSWPGSFILRIRGLALLSCNRSSSLRLHNPSIPSTARPPEVGDRNPARRAGNEETGIAEPVLY